MARPSVHFDRLVIFLAVAEAGGFTAAAERLGVTKTLVSQQVGRLEAELGGDLFTRTTRQVALTVAGERLRQECEPLVSELRAAVERFGQLSVKPSGSLRLTAPHGYVGDVLGPLLARFSRSYPDLQLELIASSEILDLVAERIDVAIRLGWLRDSSLHSTQLGEFSQVVVAAPEYLAQSGTPRTPEELSDHRWVALSLLRSPLTWSFVNARAQRRQVRVKTFAKTNSPEGVLGLVRGGAGISVLADFTAAPDLASGRLLRLLPSWTLPKGGIYAVYPHTRATPAKTRVLIDFLRRELA